MDKKSRMEKVYSIFVIFLIAWLFLGLFGMTVIPTEMSPEAAQKEIKLVWGNFLIVFVLVYLLLESFVVYLKRDLLLEPIRKFSSFMYTNGVCLMIAAVLGVMYFPAVYFIRNLGRSISSFVEGIGQATSAFIQVISEYLWVVGILVPILCFVLVKYFIYKRFIER